MACYLFFMAHELFGVGRGKKEGYATETVQPTKPKVSATWSFTDKAIHLKCTLVYLGGNTNLLFFKEI